MLEQLKLDPLTHIYLESVLPEEHHEHVYMATPIYTFKKKKKKKIKIILMPKKEMKLDPQTHIYLESVSPGEHHMHISMATPLLIFQKWTKMVLFLEKVMVLEA